MAKTTFEEIQPIMERCTKTELTKRGEPWDKDRTMLGDPPAGYFHTPEEYKISCKNIADAFNKEAGNTCNLSDPNWQTKYLKKSVRLFISAASNRAEDQANPKGPGSPKDQT